MTDTAPSTIVDRLVALIKAIDDIGLVHPAPPRDREDIESQLVSEIDGVRTLRAWWLDGPTIEGEWLTGFRPAEMARNWTWTIHGVEGLSPARPTDTVEVRAADMRTLRNNTVRVMDALDAGPGNDLGLGDSVVFDSAPCQIRQPPFYNSFFEGRTPKYPLAYVVIEKRIRTVPARS